MSKKEDGGINKKAVLDYLSKAKENATSVVKNARDAVIKTVDQNSDGKLDFEDLVAVAGRVEERLEKERLDKEYKNLKPIFRETVESPEFALPKLIQVKGKDKKHSEGKSCINSIGHESKHDDIRIITIYPDFLNLFNLKFYPNVDSEIFYVDPSDRDHYIAIDKYFEYIKLKKVGELQAIAQSLGAKHFKVSYVTENKSDSENKIFGATSGKRSVRVSADADYQRDEVGKKYNRAEVLAEMVFPGHEPIAPELCYLRGEPNIESLISMRMAKNAPIHQTVSVNLISSNGIRVKDAAKLDGALAALHFGGKVSIQKEVQVEERTRLEYEIDY